MSKLPSSIRCRSSNVRHRTFAQLPSMSVAVEGQRRLGGRVARKKMGNLMGYPTCRPWCRAFSLFLMSFFPPSLRLLISWFSWPFGSVLKLCACGAACNAFRTRQEPRFSNQDYHQRLRQPPPQPPPKRPRSSPTTSRSSTAPMAALMIAEIIPVPRWIPS